MRKLIDGSILLAVASLCLAIISRAAFKPILGLSGRSLLGVAAVLLLLATTLMMREKLQTK